jgi:hypothetical protein
LTKELSQEKFTIFTKALLLEDTKKDQSRSVEDGLCLLDLMASTISPQAGEEREASGKQETLDQCHYCRKDPAPPGNKSSSFSQIPTDPSLFTSFVKEKDDCVYQRVLNLST